MAAAAAPYRGVFPVAPTVFDERGKLDLEGQKRAIDFMIDAGSHGICILANFSEQFVLTDEERERMDAVLEHVAGRVPVIVTTTHFGTQICAERSRRAQEAGRRDGDGHAALSRRHHPGAGTGHLRLLPPGVGRDHDPDHDPGCPRGRHAALGPVPGPHGAGDRERLLFQDRGARRRPPSCATLIELGGDAIEGPWDGEEAITLMADLDAGATGAMTGGGYPDGIRQIVDPYFAGDREAAVAAYQRWLPLINYENRQCGLIAAKVLMKEGGVIRSEMTRHPVLPLHPGHPRRPDRDRPPARSAGAALGEVTAPATALCLIWLEPFSG